MTHTKFQDLGGETWRIRRFPLEDDKRWSAFNASIGYSPVEGYVVLFRSSNYFFDPNTGDTVATIGTRVKNRMFLANLDESWSIIEATQREVDFSGCGTFLRGPEDGRLYWRDGAWEISAVMREPYVTDDIPRIGTFRLDGTKASLLKLHTDGDLQPVEKTGCLFTANLAMRILFIAPYRCTNMVLAKLIGESREVLRILESGAVAVSGR